MARTKTAVEEPEPGEIDEVSDTSVESDESDDDFEPEDFEAGSEDFVDSVDADVAVVEDEEDLPLEELASESEAPDEDEDDDVPLLLTKDEEFEDYEDDDDAEVEGLREGEFVCSDCSMVFRLTALADAKAMLCRDCV